MCILPLSIFGACWLHDKSFGTSNKQVCLSASCLSSSCPRDEAAAALDLHADDCDEPAAAAAKWAEPLRQNGDCILRSASREWTSRLIEEGVARHVVRTTCLPFGLSFHDASRGSQPPHNIRHMTTTELPGVLYAAWRRFGLACMHACMPGSSVVVI